MIILLNTFFTTEPSLGFRELKKIRPQLEETEVAKLVGQDGHVFIFPINDIGH